MMSVITEIWLQNRNKVDMRFRPQRKTQFYKAQYVQGKGTLVLGSNIVHLHVEFLQSDFLSVNPDSLIELLPNVNN